MCDVIVRDFPHLPVYRDSCFDCLFMNHIGIVKTFHRWILIVFHFTVSVSDSLSHSEERNEFFGSNIITSIFL